MPKQVTISNRTRLQKLEIDLRAFVEEALEALKHLARRVHDLYFNPRCEEIGPRTRGASRTPLHRRSKNSTPFRIQSHREARFVSRKSSQGSRYAGSD